MCCTFTRDEWSARCRVRRFLLWLLRGLTLFAGEESDGTPGTPSSVCLRVNRRRTDLMPTIPSPRDTPPSTGRSSSAKAFTRSPGRTYSMSRLDQLAQPRKRPTELSTLTEQQSQPLSASSMSRSMSHLAASGGKSLKRSDNSRSMGTLPGAVPMPRPTRAERLRRKAREHQTQQQQGKIDPVHSTQRASLTHFVVAEASRTCKYRHIPFSAPFVDGLIFIGGGLRATTNLLRPLTLVLTRSR